MGNIIIRPLDSVTVSAKIEQAKPTVINVQNDTPTTITVSKGFIGPTGRTATVAVGTVSTGAAGSSASVTNVGTINDAVFNFVIPKGDQGDAASIQVGTVTALNPDQSPTVINSGTSSAAILDFGLPNAATLDLGTVTIVNPDQNPSVTDVGTSGNVVLDINIPRAADVTVQPVVSLNPDQSPSVTDTGTNGDVNLTFSIPRAAAVAVNPVSVVNPDTDPSVTDTGTNGDVSLTFSIPRAATLDLGTVTIVNPDQNPTVTDVGLNGNVVLDIGLPRAPSVTLGTPVVLNPNQNPTVIDTGTDGDAFYTFSIPRAAQISVEPLVVLTPDQNPQLLSNGTNGDVSLTFSIPRAAELSLGTVSTLNPNQIPTITDSVLAGDVTLDFGLPRAPAFSIANVTTGAPGSAATVTNDGLNGDIALNFSIPEGLKGDQGDAATLDLGVVTITNPNQLPTITNVGTINDAIFDFTIPRAADLSLGTVTIVNPNQNPAITDSGVNGDSIFNFNLPRASDVSVGTVTTGDAGTNVIITDTGINGDVLLNFTIPKGDKGDTGAPLNIIGTLADPSLLPATGNPGDAYIIAGDLYVWNETSNVWIDVGTIAGPGVALGGTTGQVLIKSSSTDYDTEWTSTINAAVIYDNTGTDLLSTSVQAAITELNDKKLDVSALTSSVTFFPTTAASDVVGYAQLVISTSDPDYNTTAVNVNTGTFTGTGNLVGSLASDPGVLVGNTTPISITTVGQVRRLTGNQNDSAGFYFEVYKRTSGGVETLIGTSDTTSAVSSDTYAEFFAAAFISDTEFTETDRVVLKFYANVVDGGGGVEYQFQYGGDTPVRTLFPVPVSVIPREYAAIDIITDTSQFAGILSGTDGTVQQALDTIDDITTDDVSEGLTNLYWKEAPSDGNQYVRQDATWQQVTIPTVPVDSVNGQTGIIVLDTDDIAEGLTNLYWKEAPADGNQYVRKDSAWSIVSLTASDVGAAPAVHTHDASDITSGTLTVAQGGTGAVTHTSGNVLVGNGTGAITSLSRSGIDTRSTFPPSAHTHTSSDITDFNTAASNAAPVQSVNGFTGSVNLTAADIGAALTTHTHTLAAITDAGTMAAENKSNVVGNVTFDTNTLHIDSVNNRVGIGTTSPGEELDVKGDIFAFAGKYGDSVTATNATRPLNLCSTNATMRILRVDASNAPAVEFLSRSTPDGSNLTYWDIYAQPTDASFRFRERTSGQADRIVIKSGGNVGIATISPGYTLDVGGTINSSSDVRAPIFYDSANTNYYVDPGNLGASANFAGSVNAALFIGNGSSLTNVNAATLGGLTSSQFARNDVYNSVNAGFQVFRNIGNIGGSWQDSDHTLSLENNDAGTLVLNFHRAGYTSHNLNYNGSRFYFDAYTESASSLRAPIFYDSNNTGYYVDPASTSNINQLNGNGKNIFVTSDGYLRINQNGDFSAGSWFGGTLVRSDGFYAGSNGGTTTSRVVISGGTYNGSNAININGASGVISVVGDVRAPIFYDSNDTGYYVDPQTTSVLWETATYYLRNIAGVSSNHTYGIYFSNDRSQAYAIFRESGVWSHPYPDLRIAFHTGIKLGANAGYNGIRFYTDYDMATQVMSVNNGSDGLGASNVYVNNSLQAGSSLRAPIFYDSNNTGFYVDPSAGLSLRTAGAWWQNTSIWSGNPGSGVGKIEYHGDRWYYVSGSNSSEVARWRRSSSDVMWLTNTGALSAVNNITAYASDGRLKHNIRNIENALDKLEKINGVTFDWDIDKCMKWDFEPSNVHEVGFIAQEIQSVLPEAVCPAPFDLDMDGNSKSGEDYLTVRTELVTPLLVEAIKEQQSMITSLEERINKLENLLEKLS